MKQSHLLVKIVEREFLERLLLLLIMYFKNINNYWSQENQTYVYTFAFTAYTAQMVDGYSIGVATKCYSSFMLTVSEI